MIARRGAAGREPLAGDEDLALVGDLGAVDQAEQLAAPRPDQAAEADDLAGANLQGRVADRGQLPHAPHVEQHLAAPGRALGVELLDAAADHQRDELVGRRRGRDAGRRRAAVGQHGDAVADPADLLEAVGDVDDADALGGEAADDAEERLDLALVEDRRRLVHDQQAGGRRRSRERSRRSAGRRAEAP